MNLGFLVCEIGAVILMPLCRLGRSGKVIAKGADGQDGKGLVLWSSGPWGEVCVGNRHVNQ